MRVHHLLLITSGTLMAIMIIVFALGGARLRTIESATGDLFDHQITPVVMLLDIEPVTYQAQRALRRAMLATEPAARQSLLSEFQRQIDVARPDLDHLQSIIREQANADEPAVRGFDAAAREWQRTADRLAGVNAGDVSNSDLDEMATRFDAVQAATDALLDDCYKPALQRQMASITDHLTLINLEQLCGLVVALLLGVLLTSRVTMMIMRQQRERDVELARQQFDTRLARGMEMAQNEEDALQTVARVINAIAPALPAEVLLADSSHAHIHQAVTTDSEHRGPGCPVKTPRDCPAVRRGFELTWTSSEDFDACPNLRGRASGPCSATCVPISIMGQHVGVLHAVAADRQPPPRDTVDRLIIIAGKTGERLGVIRAFQKSETQATTDPLTGLYNRRSFEQRVREWKQAGTPFAIAYGDIDHFKRLNDTNGHETGDRALRLFARIVRQSVREHDCAARWGGEEFVIAFSQVDAQRAGELLERLRNNLAEALRGGALPAFTVSFGVADSVGGEEADRILASADEALLAAKRAGRNRVLIAGMSAAVATSASPSEPGMARAA